MRAFFSLLTTPWLLLLIRISSKHNVSMAHVSLLPRVKTQGSDDVGVKPIPSSATSMVSYRRVGDWDRPYKLRLSFMTICSPVLNVFCVVSRSRLDEHVILNFALRKCDLHIDLVNGPVTFCRSRCRLLKRSLVPLVAS